MTDIVTGPVLRCATGSLDDFVSCWSALYRYPDDHLYEMNIGKRLTKDRLLSLFEWKNGGKISSAKLSSIDQYDFQRDTEPADDAIARRFLDQLGGGAIWGIFYLHCLAPDRFPIFDQHVHRAVNALRGLDHWELQGRARASVLDAYFSTYIASYRTIAEGRDARAVDKALWAFGKALKAPSKSAVDLRSLIGA